MAQAKLNPDYGALTSRHREIWGAGDYAAIGLATQPVADALVASVDPHAGQRVLDVACGTGNVALVLARRHCEVTAIDLVPSLVEKAKRRSAADGTEIHFLEGDAQALPLPDASFDFVFSVFGAMFAPDQQRTANELVRVCRPGGTIAMANWVADGAIATFFAAVTRNLPPVPGLEPPSRWGTVSGLRELFRDRARSFRFEQRTLTEYFRSVEHALEIFTTRFGPVHAALAALDARGKRELEDELRQLFRERNRASDGTLVMPFEYLEALITVA